MAKKKSKKTKKTTRPTSPAEKIRAYPQLVEQIAFDLHDSGRRVSATAVYHELVPILKMDLLYDFSAGTAIKQILKKAGWRVESRLP